MVIIKRIKMSIAYGMDDYEIIDIGLIKQGRILIRIRYLH